MLNRLGSARRDPHPELPVDPDPAEEARTGRASSLHTRPAHLVAVAIGGLAGTLSRYGVGRLIPTTGSGWPTATLLCNVVGAFVLGLLLEALSRRGPDTGWRRLIRLFGGTGFCGALTTYSSFALETDLLVRGHEPGLAAAYLVASVVGGLTATIIGIAVGAGHRERATAV